MKEFLRGLGQKFSANFNPPPEVINPEMSPEAKQRQREELELLLEATTEDVVVYYKDPAALL